MTPTNEQPVKGIDHIRLLRELSKKVDTWRGESILTIFRRFQRVRSPGLKEKILEIKAYDPAWTELYEAEKKLILNHLDERIIVDIRHMGSTAIPGQSSNSIIDIGLIIEDLSVLPGCEEVFSNLGYKNFGNSPIGPKTAWFWKTGSEGNAEAPDAAFVLHVDDKSNAWFAGNINFCNYLAAHPGELREYNDLKRNLRELKKENMLLYSLKKLELVIEISGKADRWAEGKGAKHG